jgi:hypothetical protein
VKPRRLFPEKEKNGIFAVYSKCERKGVELFLFRICLCFILWRLGVIGVFRWMVKNYYAFAIHLSAWVMGIFLTPNLVQANTISVIHIYVGR